jgi:hypothetical protein
MKGPDVSRAGGKILGTSSIGNFPNSPTNYNSAANGFQLYCNYAIPVSDCNQFEVTGMMGGQR